MQLEDRFYTSTEVAEILGVSLRSVYRYLEEDKITADVKTATGRHRFTRQNILDFLYPDGERHAKQKSKDETITQTAVKEEESTKVSESKPSDEQKSVQDDAETEDVQEEEVDWLSKFRAAAERHKAQIEQQPEDEKKEELVEEIEEEPKEEPKDEPKEEPEPVKVEATASLMDEQPKKEPEPVKEEKRASKINYYKSSMGGLKELAQYINKTSSKSGVEYAFTMNAGLSLHKLIRPFSVLHIYVRESDLEFFEKSLELTSTDENNAQLVIMIDGGDVLKSKKDMHGLSVVSDDQLRNDLIAAGETDLAKELDVALGA